MTNYRLGAMFALVGALLMTMTACGGGHPVVPPGSGTNPITQYASLPAPNTTYALPVPVSVMASSPNGISGWAVYFNGNEIPTSAGTYGPTGLLNTTFSTVAPGTYTVGVNTWDNTGAVKVYQASNVTVVDSPLPTPPASAKTYTNLQSATGSQGNWQICNGSCSGSSGTGSSSIALATAGAPSLSGSTLEETSTGAAFNTLGYLKPPCPTAGCTSVSNFIDNVWFYIPSTTNQLQALEFDPDVYDGSYEYFISMQCDSVSGDWRFWNMAAGQWTLDNASGQEITKYPCTLLTQTNQWHHFQLYGVTNYSAHTYSYQTFVVDGVTVYQNLGNSYSASPYTSGPGLVVEQQIDNNASATLNSVYYDNYSLTVW